MFQRSLKVFFWHLEGLRQFFQSVRVVLEGGREGSAAWKVLDAFESFGFRRGPDL